MLLGGKSIHVSAMLDTMSSKRTDVKSSHPQRKHSVNGRRACESEQGEDDGTDCGEPNRVDRCPCVAVHAIKPSGEGEGTVPGERKNLAGRSEDHAGAHHVSTREVYEIVTHMPQQKGSKRTHCTITTIAQIANVPFCPKLLKKIDAIGCPMGLCRIPLISVPMQNARTMLIALNSVRSGEY